MRYALPPLVHHTFPSRGHLDQCLFVRVCTGDNVKVSCPSTSTVRHNEHGLFIACHFESYSAPPAVACAVHPVLFQQTSRLFAT